MPARTVHALFESGPGPIGRGGVPGRARSLGLAALGRTPRSGRCRRSRKQFPRGIPTSARAYRYRSNFINLAKTNYRCLHRSCRRQGTVSEANWFDRRSGNLWFRKAGYASIRRRRLSLGNA